MGYGFGWKLLAGALTPIWSGYELSYFLFTDSTGAEYRLEVNEGGVWRSRQGVYVYYDTNTARLNFPDGSHWYMNAVSSAGEPDGGSRYPTLMRDTNGNEVRIRYAQGAGASWSDTSARILSIEDVRAIVSGTLQLPTYSFTYSTGAIPHLVSIANIIATAENYSFAYLPGQALTSPFSPAQSFGTTDLLTNLTFSNLGAGYAFEYAGGAGEMSRATFPYGGALRYAYRTAGFAGSRSTREVQTRYLVKSVGAAETSVSFQHDDSGDTGRPFHAWTRLMEDIASFQNLWTFSLTAGTSYGLNTRYDENNGGG
ncbi:MAG: hypothetical protein HY822_12455, partial [Acidobacteria bacterium]|nr:hypothetical protein [Acidobacteriota bacterium]